LKDLVQVSFGSVPARYELVSPNEVRAVPRGGGGEAVLVIDAAGSLKGGHDQSHRVQSQVVRRFPCGEPAVMSYCRYGPPGRRMT